MRKTGGWTASVHPIAAAGAGQLVRVRPREKRQGQPDEDRAMIRKFRAGGSHYEFGAAIGAHFADQIHAAYNSYDFLRAILAWHATAAGRARYAELLALHEAAFPQYMEELRGLAANADLDFRDVFLMNLRGEYRGFLTDGDAYRGCSDCSVLTDEQALIGHNEDGAPAFREHLYFLQARVADGPGFTACCYPGFLPGNAFGFNEHGICFSVDNLRPLDIRVGLGRHFLARSLLEARSLVDATVRVTPAGRASGFSYTIGSISERRILQVEAMPQASRAKEITGANFHANHAQEIAGAAQTIDASSACRVARAQQFMQQQPIKNAADILSLLSDEADSNYPIYRRAHGADSSETFCTALFDLDARTMSVYMGQPEQATVFPM